MSAFLCSARHISAIINAVPEYLVTSFGVVDELNGDVRHKLFGILAAANASSVDARYSETAAADEVRSHRYDRGAKAASVIEAIKLTQSLRYQSSEVPNWNDAQANHLLRMIEGVLITELDGYSNAAWSI